MTRLLRRDARLDFALATDSEFKCRACAQCLGRGCIGQLPGMGGVRQSHNFLLNCAAWDALPADDVPVLPEHLGIAPVTGAVQNIGYANEADFYLPYFSAAKKEGIALCVGDGAPDEKLMLGLSAVRELNASAYFFLKPYPDEKLFERLEWVRGAAVAVGMDIDAYNIITMRNQVSLERKTEAQLSEFRHKSGLPLIIKGVFTPDDIELCRRVLPDIIVVSNHGGRVETAEGSTAEFLAANSARLTDVCGELWVDGGIRKTRDVQAALTLGVKKCIAARPFIASLIRGGEPAMQDAIRAFFNY